MLGYFSAGDSPFFFPEQLQAISWLPKIWDGSIGFGKNVLVQLWLDYPIRLFIKLCSSVGLSWWAIDKILWIIPFVMSAYAIYSLTRYIGLTKWARFIAIGIYVLNTYVLLLFDGGQRGVLLAYSLAPLVLLKFMNLMDEGSSITDSKSKKINQKFVIHNHISNGLWLALLIVLDLRIAYLTLVALGLYLGLIFLKEKDRIKRIYTQLSMIIYPLVVACFIHAFWILPSAFTRTSITLGEEFTSTGMLTFLSVADFSHAFSLLHPNWPENLFGKVYFLQPEFLVLPLLAFGSLLFVSKIDTLKSKIHILFFLLLSLFGVYFAKGVNGPYGAIFLWMYEHVPGFVMFRDPTKFYLYIALGYSILIPFTLVQISLRITRILKKYSLFLIPNSLIIVFIIFWLFTIRPVFLGNLSGNFQPKSVPTEYERFKNMLVADTVASRVLWLPSAESFSYSSDIHPLLTSQQLFKTSSITGILNNVSTPAFQESIYSAGVKYIVIPIDVWKRIFLHDYTYDGTQKDKLMLTLQKYYKQDLTYTDLKVFRNDSFHFKADKPLYIAYQEYWTQVGLSISGGALFFLCVILFVKYRN